MLSRAPLSAVLPVADIERAKKFYGETVGLTPHSVQVPAGYAMFEAGNATTILLYERPAVSVEHTQVCFRVSGLEAEMKELRSKGVSFEEYDFPGLKTVNGIATLDNTKSAWFKDPDGNIISVTEVK